MAARQWSAFGVRIREVPPTVGEEWLTLPGAGYGGVNVNNPQRDPNPLQ